MFAWKFTLLAFPVSIESETIKTRGVYVILISQFKKLLINFVSAYGVSLPEDIMMAC